MLPASLDTYNIEGLQAGKRYEIRIISLVGSQESKPVAITATTGKGQPSASLHGAQGRDPPVPAVPHGLHGRLREAESCSPQHLGNLLGSGPLGDPLASCSELWVEQGGHLVESLGTTPSLEH